jgi:copper chaperone CopZ
MSSLKLKISGMTCDHCRRTVENALKEVDGTFGASVLLQDGEAEVDFDPNRASLDLYVRAVQAAGYGAKLID